MGKVLSAEVPRPVHQRRDDGLCSSRTVAVAPFAGRSQAIAGNHGGTVSIRADSGIQGPPGIVSCSSVPCGSGLRGNPSISTIALQAQLDPLGGAVPQRSYYEDAMEQADVDSMYPLSNQSTSSHLMSFVARLA